MIRELGESVGRAVLDGIGRAASRVQERKPLPADLLEDDEAFLAVFDAPGANATDVTVRFEGRTLEVHVDRFREVREEYDLRFPGRGLVLSGTVTLPADADVEADLADATLTANGTLEVLIPKRGSERARRAKAALEDGDAEDGVETHDDETTAGPGDVQADATDAGGEGSADVDEPPVTGAGP